MKRTKRATPPPSPAHPSVSRSANTGALPPNQLGAEVKGLYPDVSREKLAREIGKSKATVSKYLDGSVRIPMDIVGEVARLVGKGTDELIGELGGIRRRKNGKQKRKK